MTNREKDILQKLRKKARGISQECYNPNCKNKAIRSHIQQVEGSIRKISSADGKIIQLEDLDRNFNDKPYGFKEKGIKQKGDVLTFWGFCNPCDSRIFKNIESGHINYASYYNQILFSYRGFLSEFYKQEYNLKWYELIFKSNQLSDETKKIHENLYLKFSLSIREGKFIKKLFESDLKKATTNFEFIHFKLPLIEVCTSTSYSFPKEIRLDNTQLKELISKDSFPPFSRYYFINLIPTKDELNVILGYNLDQVLKLHLDLNKISRLTKNEKMKLISDILIRHVETWFISKSLYNIWRDRKLDNEILRQIGKYLPAKMKEKYVRFNLFHDII